MSMIGVLSVVVSLAQEGMPEPTYGVTVTGADGRLLRIACSEETCRVSEWLRSGRWRTLEETQCGRTTFDMLEFKYRATGLY